MPKSSPNNRKKGCGEDVCAVEDVEEANAICNVFDRRSNFAPPERELTSIGVAL